MIAGAGSVFLVNIVLKATLSDFEYGEYSIFITFLQVCVSFGFLGLEQVFLRLSEVSNKDDILTDKKLLKITFGVGLLLSVLLSVVFSRIFLKIEIALTLLVLLTFSTSLMMFLYNIVRLKKQFITAQLFNNMWKYIILAITAVLLINGTAGTKILIEVFTYIAVGSVVIFSVYVIKNVPFKFTNSFPLSTISRYSFHFILSMLTLTVIGFFDRFYIKAFFGSVAFGNYFYLSTIFYFPFALLQGYIGFKELVFFKTNASLRILKKKLIRINFLSLGIAIIIFSTAYVLNELEIIPAVDFNSNTTIIFIFMFLGLLRINYSMLSSVLGAIGSIKIIRNANIQSIVFILFIFAVCASSLESVETVAFCILLIWISRIAIWYYNAVRQLKINAI
ncbi:MAG: O-antigen/teichoic acid export membrane protein [Patiriisocius sp.]|jgi:O-antigen/teichoic acid export membrane protein